MRSRETEPRQTSRRPRTVVAAFAVAVIAAALAASAIAGDDIFADGDAVAAGTNESVALGTVAPGATVSRAIRFTLECKTRNHVDAGDTLSLTYAASASSIPSGGSVSAGGGSIVPPLTWPADGDPCVSPQAVSSGGAGTGSDSSVTLTAPSAPGSYSYVLEYQLGGTGLQPSDISSSNLKITYTLTVADVTPPSITPSISGTLGSDSWYTGSVAVAWTVTDAQSAVTSPSCGSTNIVSDTPGVTVSCSATSAGGTATNSVTIKRDATIPTVAIDAGVPTSTTAGSLLVTGSAADATSGVASVAVNGDGALFTPLDGTFSKIVNLACGPNLISVASRDSAGNVSAAVTRTVDYICDSTAPSITPSISGTLGSNGWYTSDVGVAWTVTDGQSAVSSQTGCGSSSVASDTGGVTFTCSATSAGGTATKSVTIKRDATAPLASASALSGGSPYLADTWTREDVVVSYVCSDAMSGVAATTGEDDDTVSAESASGSASGICRDEAGNTASASFAPIKIDKTAPSASAAAVSGGSEYLAGSWTRNNVVVSYTCSDELSGVASTSADDTVSGESASGSASGSCLDEAGNSSSASFSPIRIDKTAPSVEFTGAAPAASASGWRDADVTATFTATDALSGFAPSGSSRSAEVVSSGEGDPVLVESPAFTDLAGNTAAAGAASQGFRIDKTDPSISASALSGGSAYLAGSWTRSDVVVSYACSDELSGVASTSGDDTVSAESASGSALGSCLDEAGNSASASFAPIRIDKTAPSISASAVSGGSPYSAGTWTNKSVVVSYACSDALSGVAATVDDDDTVSAESASGSASGSCRDEAGNSSSASFSPIKIDKSAPSASAAAVSGGSEYLAGAWTRNDVVVRYTCSDDLSGVASTPADETVSGESASGSASGACLDNAGNSASASFSPIRIDKTAPSVEFTGAAPAANASGWHDSDVTATFTATDTLSGFAPSGSSRSAEVVSSGEGDSVVVESPAFTDLAGNTAAAGAASQGFKIDKTDPSISASAMSGGSPYSAGTWTNRDVLVSYACADSLSGVAATADDDEDTLSAESASGSASGSCRDEAGNSASASFSPIKIDKTDPSISASAASGGSAYSAGTWTNQDVVVSYACADSLSGLAASEDDDDDTVSAESASGSAAGTCRDQAGNSASDSFGPIKIDKTAPSLTFVGQSPAKNAHGWNRMNVTLTWSCADTLSGPVTPMPSQVIATEGADQQATGSCSDLAGNAAAATDGDVDIDKTKPALGITGSPTGTAFGVCTLPTRPAFAPADALSGLDGSQGDSWTPAAAPSGAGISTYEAHATDLAGNAAVETRSYTTTYGSATVAQSPYLQPINKDGTSRFKLGSTIPVKFQAVCNGLPVATVVARLYVKQGDGQPDPGVDEAFSTSAATSGNLFRWSDGQYIFNLSTKLGYGNPDGTNVAAFGLGTWTLKLGLDDGTWRSVNIQIVK